MAIRFRTMRPKDAIECVRLIAAHPVAGPRFGDAIDDLRSAWLKLLGSEGFLSYVFEEEQQGAVRFLGGGVSAFISDEFVKAIKTPPFFWIGPELAKQVCRGKSPVLSNAEVRQANSTNGLNCVIWQLCLHAQDTLRLDVSNYVMSTFLQVHRGFVIKEMICLQAIFPEELQWFASAGALSVDHRTGSYVDIADEVMNRPHVFGLTRELAASHLGTWLGSLFTCASPRFGFRPSEKRQLLSALIGVTDEELAEDLTVSLSAVKKAWRSIYDRTTPYLFMSDGPEDGHETQERGRGKKQRLLSYLREHPEELRPHSPKLSREAAQASSAVRVRAR
jgi:hypothetical protein